jgi:allantoin racemase
MRIKVINPNTTISMTAKIAAAARAAAGGGTEILGVSPDAGPVSIEGHYDEAISTIGLLEEIRKGEQDRVDGYVIACFGDPGLLAAREIASGPVIGIAEGAMHLASLISTGFTVVTTLGRTKVIARHLVQNYGFERSCRNIRSTELAVLDLEDSERAQKAILAECRLAVEQDEAGAIVLGCAGMADLANRISQAIGIPVVEGVTAAVKLVELLISTGLRTSKVGDLAYPLPKTYVGNLARFAVEGR